MYVTCRKFLKITKLANFSAEAISPTLFQVLTIRLTDDPCKVDVLQYGDLTLEMDFEYEFDYDV